MPDPSTGAMQNFRPPAAGRPDPDESSGLVLLYTEDFGTLAPVWPLKRSRQTIGREARNDLHLPVSAVSREHAEIWSDRSQFRVRDLKSTNGTLIDGVRIEDDEALDPNCELRIGDAIFKFVAQGIQSYGGYRLDGTMVAPARRLFGGPSPLVGGYQMDKLSAALKHVAKSNLSVLLLGESGTGKEVAARLLHQESGRRGEFHAVNCAALPENLIESELFGYKKGAFSGAERDKPGYFQAAHRGTLLLDEIGDMPLPAQAKLLRVLQSREVVPVGSTKPEPVDVRIVAATHRDLTRAQREGRFRPDLFARLNEFAAVLPPLRERKEDIYQLVRRFWAAAGRADLHPSFPFMAALLHYDWPYNVRELESAMKRAAALADGTELREEHLPDAVAQAMADYSTTVGRSRSVEAPTEEELRTLLAEADGNVAEVGRRLGKARMQIHRWMSRYSIEIAEYRR